MKRAILYTVYGLLNTIIVLGNWQCRKDEDGFRPYDDTLTQVDAVLEKVPEGSFTTVFSFSGPVPDTVLTTPSGLQLQLVDTEQLFVDEEGTLVPCSACQDLKVEITEVRKKGDLLALGLFTEGSDHTVLDAVAVVDVRISCAGKPLELLPDRIALLRIPVSGAGLNDQFRSFHPTVDSSVFYWKMPGSPSFFAEWPVQANSVEGYELVLERLGRVACARPVESNTHSTFCVNLDAPPYNNQNTRIFLVFEGLNGVVELKSEIGTTLFCIEKAPLGFPVRVVSVSNINNSFELGNYVTEIGTNSETPLSPVPVSEQDIIDLLRSL